MTEHDHSEMTSQYCPVCGDTLQEPISLNKGEIIITEIDELGIEGDGIARIRDEFIVIVPSGKVGETVKAEITSVGRKLAFAEKKWSSK